MSPKIIFIDWDGTMSVSKFWGKLEDQDLYYQIQKFLFVNNKDILSNWVKGSLTLEEVLTKIFDGTGIDEELLLSELKRSCEEMDLVSPEVLELVGKVRNRGIKVLIATDNMDTFERWTVPSLRLNEHFDGILNSFYLQAFKRDGDKFFGNFLRSNGINPKDCLIIDDSENNKDPLANYGLDYRKIERGIGLVPELNKILGSLHVETK